MQADQISRTGPKPNPSQYHKPINKRDSRKTSSLFFIFKFQSKRYFLVVFFLVVFFLVDLLFAFADLVEDFELVDFFAGLFPKADSHPSAYFSVEPTRITDTTTKLLKNFRLEPTN